MQRVSLCTWRKEFPALEVVCLASALVAVGVETRQAVHQVVVLRAGAVPTVAVLRKVAGVHGFSARGSRNSELRQRRVIEPSEIHSVSLTSSTPDWTLTWQLSQQLPSAQAEPLVNLQVAASQHLLSHSCLEMKSEEEK